jgi:integrase
LVLGEGRAWQRATLGAWVAHVVDVRESMRATRGGPTERSCVRVHIAKDPIALVRLVDLETRDVLAWLRRMMAKRAVGHGAHKRPRPLSAKSVHNVLVLLRRALAHAVSVGLVDRNVAREVQVPRGAKTRTREEFEGVLSPAEQSALLAASYAGGGDLGDMVAVAMGAGLRRRELLSLEGGHVDVGARQVVIRFGGKGGAPTKSGKPRRVPLFGVAWRALEGRAAREGVCFPSRRDGARTKVPRSAFLRAVQAAGIGRPIRWHDLRHTCATSLLMGWWGKVWTLTEVQAFCRASLSSA